MPYFHFPIDNWQLRYEHTKGNNVITTASDIQLCTFLEFPAALTNNFFLFYDSLESSWIMFGQKKGVKGVTNKLVIYYGKFLKCKFQNHKTYNFKDLFSKILIPNIALYWFK